MVAPDGVGKGDAPEFPSSDVIGECIGNTDAWQLTTLQRSTESAALNYNHLRYFWTVAHEGSIAAAVARLDVSQPTISEQLQAIDRAGVFTRAALARDAAGAAIRAQRRAKAGHHAVVAIADAARRRLVAARLKKR